MICVTADNAHIAELINAVKAMISKQKQQTTALMKTNTYMIALQFEAAAAATKSFPVHKVLMCLVREIIISSNISSFIVLNIQMIFAYLINDICFF